MPMAQPMPVERIAVGYMPAATAISPVPVPPTKKPARNDAAPSVAIDLPLKILVWEDPGGKAWISYNAAAYLQARHTVPPELIQNIAVAEALAAKVFLESEGKDSKAESKAGKSIQAPAVAHDKVITWQS